MNKMLNSGMVDKFRRWIEESSRIVLTCHVRPDGDAIGSTLGMMHLLQSLGKKANVVVPDQPPRNLAFLSGFNEISIFTRHEEYSRRLFAEADLIICSDFNKPSRQDSMADLTMNAPARKVMVDHHQQPDAFCDLSFSYPDMSSASELMFRLIAAMGYYPEMNLDSATCICTGMITDTRNFSVNCKNPDIYEILMRLLEKGVDKTRIVKEALLTRSLWSLRLESYALAEKLEIFEKFHGAVTTLDKDELKRFHYERGDTEGLVNQPLNVRGIYFSFFLREDDDCVKVSARSIEDFPVSKICEDLFGGGGHIMAAGAEFKGSLKDCRRILIEALPDYLRYLPSRPRKVE
ncbi:MAG: bifunctional oligoribonuclease/PAP phosphatase NrnA [Bacteroidales bacterium]|nr:bifunctional oligoribonuclease/PAP phosphatase NrnA [Bacteroidales bacterium]